MTGASPGWKHTAIRVLGVVGFTAVLLAVLLPAMGQGHSDAGLSPPDGAALWWYLAGIVAVVLSLVSLTLMCRLRGGEGRAMDDRAQMGACKDPLLLVVLVAIATAAIVVACTAVGVVPL